MFARDHTRICSRPFARMDASIYANGRHQSTKNFEKQGRHNKKRYNLYALLEKRDSTDATDETDSRAFHLRWLLRTCVRDTRSVAINMLIFFAIARRGDTSADRFTNQHYIHDYQGRIVQIIRHCADENASFRFNGTTLIYICMSI